MVKTKGNSDRMKSDNPMFNEQTKSKRLRTIKSKGDWGKFNVGQKRPKLTKSNLENNPMRNPEIKKKAVLSYTKTMKKKYENLEEREKFSRRMLDSQHKRPTLPEKAMLSIIEKNNLPFNYVGSGQIFIGGFNPDFLSKNPKHIIEVNGDYWHNLPTMIEKDKRKIETYGKYGYKVLTFWEHELVENKRQGKRLSEQEIISKIKSFMGGN